MLIVTSAAAGNSIYDLVAYMYMTQLHSIKVFVEEQMDFGPKPFPYDVVCSF